MATAVLRKKKAVLQTDENGHYIITKDYLKDLCEENEQYITPNLNNTLYLHFKGSICLNLSPLPCRLFKDREFGGLLQFEISLAGEQLHHSHFWASAPD